MTWHEGHDVRMMVEHEGGPGSVFGPLCRDCGEHAIFSTVPTDEDIAKAGQRVRELIAEGRLSEAYLTDLSEATDA